MLSLQQRSGEPVKVHQLDVAIPLQLKSQLKKGQPCLGEADSDISDTMQFVMLTRKGNKQQVRSGGSFHSSLREFWSQEVTAHERSPFYPHFHTRFIL